MSQYSSLAATLTTINVLMILVFIKEELINPRRVILAALLVKTLDSRIVVSEFELQSRYYVHFRTNTIGKGMKPLILPSIG